MANATYTFTQSDGDWDYATGGWAKTSHGTTIPTITSGKLTDSGSSDSVFVWTSFTPVDADYGAECVFTVTASYHSSIYMGIGVVIDEVTPASLMSGYFIRYSDGNIELSRRLDRYTATTVVSLPVTANTGGKIAVKRVVNAGDVTLSVYFNDTLLETTPGDGYSFVDTDANRLTSVGRVGVYNGSANSGTLDNVYVDDVYDPAPANDDDPDPLTFNSKTDVPTSTLQTSDPSNVTGINVLTAFTVANGEAEINSSGSWVTSGSVSNNDSIKLRHTSSASNSTPTVTTLTFTVSGDTATFTSTTVAANGGGFVEPLYDVFVGSGELIETTTSESGHYWAKKAGSIDVFVHPDGADVDGNGQAIWHSVDSLNNFYIPASTDYKIRFTQNVVQYYYSTLQVGIYVGVDNDFSGYYAHWNNGEWRLTKTTDQYTDTVLDTIAAIQGSDGDPSTQDVEVVLGRTGNDVYLTVDGVTVTVTDTTWLSGGTVGVFVDYANASGSSYLKSISTTLEGQPEITSVTAVREGESFTIAVADSGTAGTVEIGGVVCAQTSYSDTSITVTAPSDTIGYGVQSLKITRTDTGAFSSQNVDYLPPTGFDYVTLDTAYADLSNRSVIYQNATYNDVVSGDQIKYEVAANPSGTVSLDAEATVTVTGAPASGDVDFDLVVLDASSSYARGVTETVTLTESANTAPVFTGTVGTQLATSGSVYSFDFSSYFSDADGDALTYQATGLPSEYSVVGSTITGTFTEATNSYTVTITALDGRGGSASSNAFTLQIDDGIAPVISGHESIQAVAAFTGEALAVADSSVQAALSGVTATDETDGSVSVNITGLSDGMTIAGSPYAFTATATDVAGNVTNETGSLTIVLDSTAPVFDAFTTPQTLTLNTGETDIQSDDARVTAIFNTVTATDDYGTVSIINDAPETMAAANSPYVINFFAIDQANNTASTSLTLNIELDGVNNAPVFTSSNAIAVTQGQTVTHTLTATDADGDAITFGESGAWPYWAHLVGDTITLNPDNTVVVQDYVITANVTDGVVNVTQQITITLAPATFDAPIKRVVDWDTDGVPVLVIGDDFWHLATLQQGLNSTAFNFSNATSVKAAVVSHDHSEAYTAATVITASVAGSDWDGGVLSLLMPSSTTDDMANVVTKDTMAKVEIELTMGGNTYTWFAPVLVRPGYIN